MRAIDPTDHSKDREMFIQSVIDLRRGFDLLLARGDVVPTRLAYVAPEALRDRLQWLAQQVALPGLNHEFEQACRF